MLNLFVAITDQILGVTVWILDQSLERLLKSALILPIETQFCHVCLDKCVDLQADLTLDLYIWASWRIKSTMSAIVAALFLDFLFQATILCRKGSEIGI